MRVLMGDYLQLVKRNYRVKIEVPEHLPAYLPAPHTNKKFLVKGLGVSNRPEARKLREPWVREFKAAIDVARSAYDAAQEMAALARGEDWEALSHYSDADDRALSEQFYRQAEANRRGRNRASRPEDMVAAIADQVAKRLKPAPAPIQVVSYRDMISKWETDGNKGLKAVEDMQTKCRKFIWYLESDDLKVKALDPLDKKQSDKLLDYNMATVGFEDVRDWLEEMLENGDPAADGREMASKSVSNHLRAVFRLFKFSTEKQHLKGVNPATVKYTPQPGVERDDFTMAERALILEMSRTASSELKWLVWLSHFLLTRTSEVADAHTRDIVQEDGIWLMLIHKKNRSSEQGLKTAQSTRKIALPDAVIDEVFLDYWRGLPEGPLFPGLRLSSYGKRAGHASNITSDWLREVVGIKDEAKPFYSLRHSGITDLRTARNANGDLAISPEVVRYLTAHGRKDVHGQYGKYPLHELKAAMEYIKNPLKAVVVPFRAAAR